ncbi:MAG: hypothetical protein H7Z16_09595 [Pyrinomonadaceae bacterium]|nr:hypothetical protein [Pyrinomonadaceae bacterium]
MNASQIQPTSRWGANRFAAAFILAAAAGLAVNGQATQTQTQDFTAPPPVKVISSLERDQLNASKDHKARVKVSIVLAEAHLAKAEAHTVAHEYDSASGEAARYWAIIENAFGYLRGMKLDSNRTRDLYKRLELALRAHAPRLSGLRRTTPSEYAVWIKEIEEFARKGRTEALNSFYGDTVVRDSHPPAVELKTVPKPSQENSAAPRQKP